MHIIMIVLHESKTWQDFPNIAVDSICTNFVDDQKRALPLDPKKKDDSGKQGFNFLQLSLI